ncbi:hypothetical protein F5Y16DRAFT_403584 [Xylariaceae sp. FL0255]|nr:hypothetical protein F5Y16DRAFT_403584 [Xylariaceae sp. FL0255]
MSGLEAVAALSLACNVLQLVEMGHQTIQLIKRVYQGGSLDDTLEQNVAILESISHEIKTSKRPIKCQKHEQQLLLTAEKCSAAAGDLREEISFLVGNAKQGSLVSTLKIVSKVNWRKRRLERLKETLDNAEKNMQTGLLAQIWSSTSTAQLDIEELKGDFRLFVEQLQKGHRSTEELVSREGLKIRSHISSMSKETNDSLKSVHKSLDKLALDAQYQGSKTKRDRLLQSLKFPGMNERRNQVDDAYKDTGKWVFAGDDHGISLDGPDGSSSSNSDSVGSKMSEINWHSFSNWLCSTDVLYWISGKPGSGKTTLMKFILNHSKTKLFLNIWKTNALIISHFLWRPGTSLQQNIKGLLCSLLFQLLQNSPANIDIVHSSDPHSDMKETVTDWSTAELLTLCLRVQSAYHRPICIFLDGLDEVDPRDGVTRLLDMVERLSQNENIKICVSSRPEPLLQKRLSAYPRLRLQDLNMRDLESYAREHVSLPNRNNAEHDMWDPIQSLVHKAEGVFLWLVLAIRSINKGIELGDTMVILVERIDRLPGDLTRLYKDMWTRTCDDDPRSYRQTAALYFKLLLAHSQYPAYFQILLGDFDLFTFMLASTTTADEILLNPRNAITEDALLQRCQEVQAKLDVCCFGLIEVRSQLETNSKISFHGLAYRKLVPFMNANKVLQFIHRTAYDFLVDTPEGKEIMSFDDSTALSIAIHIIKACLAERHLYVNVRSPSSFDANCVGPLLYTMSSLRLTYEHSDEWAAEDWTQVITHCEGLCNAGKLFVGLYDLARHCRNEDFLKMAANTCGDKRILSEIRDGKLSKDTKSEILLNACNMFVNGIGFLGSRISYVEELVRMLLREGADPNYNGIIFSPDLWFWPFAQLETPFTKYLESMLLIMRRELLSSEELFTALETIRMFIYYNADLDQRITLFFRIVKYNDRSRDGLVPILEPFILVQLRWIKIHVESEGEESTLLLASFSTRDVLEVILHHVREEYASLVKEKKFFERLLSIETECKGKGGSFVLLGRVRARQDLSFTEPVTWEVSAEEQQGLIATKLMCFLRDWRVRWRPYISPRTTLENSVEDALSRYAESLSSLCAEVPWTLEASGTYAVLWQKLHDLGVFTRIDETCEVHSIEDWMKI